MVLGSGQQVDGPYEKWKPNLKVIKAVIQFVMETSRFQPRATVVDEVIGDRREGDEEDVVLEMGESSSNDDVGGSH